MSGRAATQFREGLNADQELRDGLALALAEELPVRLEDLLSRTAINVLVQYAAAQGYIFTAEEAAAEYAALRGSAHLQARGDGIDSIHLTEETNEA